eukprot:CAMPEP_0184712282 /NCGR_PEP_ID=MMETSP0314-20130426/2857_1 /TAXON_ID=38298 /ORGANISM="Rhodella maculata, Strain CCMP 736" /LENGTH=64 /DNA_ID=CAMNT_0027174685 /DNA_START=10 /DNA_END=200 /DNA_ORIENTATION=+
MDTHPEPLPRTAGHFFRARCAASFPTTATIPPQLFPPPPPNLPPLASPPREPHRATRSNRANRA